MTLKKKLFFAFAAIVVLVPIYAVFSSQNALNQGELYTFKLKMDNSFDAYQESFLRVNFTTNEVKTKFDFDERETVYVSIGEDEDGFAFFDEALKSPPENKDYFLTTIESRGSSHEIEMAIEEGDFDIEKLDVRSIVRIKIPNSMNKFFISEEDARRVVTVSRSEIRNSHIAVRIHEGQARLENVFVQDQPVLDYLDAKGKK